MSATVVRLLLLGAGALLYLVGLVATHGHGAWMALGTGSYCAALWMGLASGLGAMAAFGVLARLERMSWKFVLALSLALLFPIGFGLAAIPSACGA